MRLRGQRHLKYADRHPTSVRAGTYYGISANACGRSRRASLKRSANRSSTRTQCLARSRLNPGIGAAAILARSDRRCSQRLARPCSRGPTRAAHGVRQPWKRAQPIRSRAQCATSLRSSVGVVIARRACRRRVGSMAFARSQLLAKRSQRRPPRATIRAAAPPQPQTTANQRPPERRRLVGVERPRGL